MLAKVARIELNKDRPAHPKLDTMGTEMWRWHFGLRWWPCWPTCSCTRTWLTGREHSCFHKLWRRPRMIRCFLQKWSCRCSLCTWGCRWPPWSRNLLSDWLLQSACMPRWRAILRDPWNHRSSPLCCLSRSSWWSCTPGGRQSSRSMWGRASWAKPIGCWSQQSDFPRRWSCPGWWEHQRCTCPVERQSRQPTGNPSPDSSHRPNQML